MLAFLRRYRNPEIALGFFIASLFWVAVLGWQASSSLTEEEKKACENAAHNAGLKKEECKTIWEKTTSALSPSSRSF